MLGRGKRAHDEFKSSLVHAIQESGVASDARTEARLSAWGVDGTGVSYDSDVVYFESDGRKVVLECSRLDYTELDCWLWRSGLWLAPAQF